MKKVKKSARTANDIKNRMKQNDEVKGYKYDQSPSKIMPEDKELFPDLDQALSGFDALVQW